MTLKQPRQLGWVSFALLAVLVGLVAGLGAVVFRGLIALFHNLLFLGSFSFSYNANVHTPASPWGLFIILVPVLGALGVAFLVKNFAPEAKGHGVPEVMDAIYYAKGVIRPVVAAVKSVASALSIGSGGSVGREGPIIQIGSSFGSTVGQILRLPPWQTITLIAAGAGGGIAATFNTPVGGVLFAIEIMMHEVSVKTLVPVAISTATATYIGRLFFGAHPSFVIPQFEMPYFHLTHPLIIVAYVGLGVIMGAVAALFIKSIYGAEDFFEKHIPGGYYTRHLLGMLLVGVIIYLVISTTGHYYIEGVGYSTVQDVLSSTQSSLFLLAILFILKLLTTSLTLGSGASGGIFSPALYMGATLGGAYGIILDSIFPGLGIMPSAFAVAGMAGLVGGATGAAMTAIVMIFEMTLDYNVIIPMTITVAISYGIRKFLSTESIYTLKNVRRGHYMPEALQANMQFIRRLRDVMEKRFTVVSATSTLKQFAGILSQQPTVSYFLVAERGEIVGVIRRYAVIEEIERLGKTATLGKIAKKDYLIMTAEAMLSGAIRKMRSNQASIILVTSQEGTVASKDVQGMITAEEIANSIAKDADIFSD